MLDDEMFIMVENLEKCNENPEIPSITSARDPLGLDLMEEEATVVKGIDSKFRKYVTPVQKQLLAYYTGRYPELNDPPRTQLEKTKHRAMWNEVTATLNKVPRGAQKDANSWRRTWIDAKKLAKKKSSQTERNPKESDPTELVSTQSQKFDTTFITPAPLLTHINETALKMFTLIPSPNVAPPRLILPAPPKIDPPAPPKSEPPAPPKTEPPVLLKTEPLSFVPFASLSQQSVETVSSHPMPQRRFPKFKPLGTYQAAKLKELRLARRQKMKEAFLTQRYREHKLEILNSIMEHVEEISKNLSK